MTPSLKIYVDSQSTHLNTSIMMYFIMTPFCDTINYIGSLNGNKNLRLNFNDIKNGTIIEIEKEKKIF